MRRLPILCLVTLPWWTACTEQDPPPLFFKIDYQVRCDDCEPRTMDDPERSVRGLDGERGFDVVCRTALQGGDRHVSFSALHFDSSDSGENFGIEIAQVNLEASEPGASCRVSVTEGDNSYEGQCTADEPSEDAPCQVELEVDGDVISGSVFCDKIPNRSTSDFFRDLVAPGTLDEPAEFEVQGCEL